ncbi:MAG: hypothetical protein A4E53_01480 [Pelotomaculum sp. PtaB.Bin104]|nr:MAG: hypothetical protein A4E53_01480 [Pelotomaculum sp. PtaB.Bin104]
MSSGAVMGAIVAAVFILCAFLNSAISFFIIYFLPILSTVYKFK